MMDRVLHRHRLREETGTGLVEVIAAAMLLIVISGAVTALVSAAQRQSGDAKIVSIASDVAQTQVEELRAKRFSDLVGLDDTLTLDTAATGGYKMFVKRKTGWAADADTAPVSCSSTANKPQALKLTVSVTWEDMGNRKPVSMNTLVATPVSEETKGNYVVQIDDRDGNGVSGVNVSLAGPESASGSTDASGCVRFSGLDQGPYTLTFARSGYVNESNVTNISDTITVKGGETGSKSFNYDAGGFISATFQRQTTSAGAKVDYAPPGVIFENATTMLGTLTGAVGTNPTPLWPATSQYGVHADTCTSAGLPVASAAVPRGATAAVTALLPLIDVALPKSALGSTANANTVRVKVTTQCGSVLPEYSTYWDDGTNYRWQVPVPPGTLASVCAYAYLSPYWYWKRWLNYPVAATDTWPGSRPALPADLYSLPKSTSKSAVCTS